MVQLRYLVVLCALCWVCNATVYYPFPISASTSVTDETARAEWLASETAAGNTVVPDCVECGSAVWPKYPVLSWTPTLHSWMRWKFPGFGWRDPIAGGSTGSGRAGCLPSGSSIFWHHLSLRSESDYQSCYFGFSTLQFTALVVAGVGNFPAHVSMVGCGFTAAQQDYTSWNARPIASPAALKRNSDTFQCMSDELECRSWDAAHFADDGHQALFQCLTGYSTRASNKLIALNCITSTLSLATDSAASCQLNSCGSFPVAAIGIQTSSVTSEMLYGDTTEITCLDGFQLSEGDSTVECLADGSFSQNPADICHDANALKVLADTAILKTNMTNVVEHFDQAFDAKFVCTTTTNVGQMARWCSLRRQ